MGTRCLTVVKDDEGKEICVLYRQFDGYKAGHGKELKEFLKGKKLVNGMFSDEKDIFNGMHCLAASLVAYFKKEPSGFYLFPAGTRGCWEGYIYTIEPGKKPGTIKCTCRQSTQEEADTYNTRFQEVEHNVTTKL